MTTQTRNEAAERLLVKCNDSGHGHPAEVTAEEELRARFIRKDSHRLLDAALEDARREERERIQAEDQEAHNRWLTRVGLIKKSLSKS